MINRKKIKAPPPAPAPEPLEIVQAFINTRNLKKATDELSNPW